MERLDANGDGRLQFAEFEAWFVDNYNEQEHARKKGHRGLGLAKGPAAAGPGGGAAGPHEEDDEFESHSPRQLIVDKNNHVLLLDVATNEVEVYKEVWKPTINADGVSIKKPHMKLVASLRETIDGKPLDNTFCISLGGRDHILVIDCEMNATLLAVTFFENTESLFVPCSCISFPCICCCLLGGSVRSGARRLSSAFHGLATQRRFATRHR